MGYDDDNLRKMMMEVDNTGGSYGSWVAHENQVRMTSYTCFCGNLCARLYEHSDFKGDYLPIGGGEVFNVRTKFTEKWNDKVSSIKVESNCVFTPYRDPGYVDSYEPVELTGRHGKIDAIKQEYKIPFVSWQTFHRHINFEDKITSWKCKCKK